MPPITLNRRRFLGCSAAAGLAFSKGIVAGESEPVRVGVIGLGTRGTSLLRTLLELPSAKVIALCDSELKHRMRARGIVEKARGEAPDVLENVESLLERSDIDAVAIALPCDRHAGVYASAIQA